MCDVRWVNWTVAAMCNRRGVGKGPESGLERANRMLVQGKGGNDLRWG